MRELKIGNLTAKVPIIQGGMGVGVSLDALAAAVANEGGIGTLSATGVGFDLPEYKENPEETSVKALRELIRSTREKTDGIVAINIMVALSNYELFVKTAVEEKIDIVFSGAGLPLELPKFLTDNAQTKLVPIVSSVRAANIITKKWLGKYN